MNGSDWCRRVLQHFSSIVDQGFFFFAPESVGKEEPSIGIVFSETEEWEERSFWFLVSRADDTRSTTFLLPL